MARVLAALGELPDGIARELDASAISNNPITIVGDYPRVDILTIAWTVTFEHAWGSRVVRRIEGVRVPYLGRDDLIASKQTGRPADQADIEVLTSSSANGRVSGTVLSARSQTLAHRDSRPFDALRSAPSNVALRRASGRP